MVSYDTIFIASVSLLGFISIFIIFRYRTIDIYVDNKKNALRLLFEKEIQQDPDITVYIQSLGKNQDETKLLIDSVKKTSQNKINPIEVFKQQIIDYREKRKRNIFFGSLSIVLWTCLSFIILFNIFSEIHYIGLFIIFLSISLTYILIELLEGYEE